MALLRIPAQQRTVRGMGPMLEILAPAGIGYEVWALAEPLDPGAPAEAILEAYRPQIERLEEAGGYTTSDVIDVGPQTPNLEAMLAKFRREHWHDEDEVRFIIEGHGVFHIHPAAGPVFAIEVEPGDLIRVPRGTRHWFDLCSDRRIRAIRLFQDPAGWTPRYSESGLEADFQTVCFGPAFVASARQD